MDQQSQPVLTQTNLPSFQYEDRHLYQTQEGLTNSDQDNLIKENFLLKQKLEEMKKEKAKMANYLEVKMQQIKKQAVQINNQETQINNLLVEQQEMTIQMKKDHLQQLQSQQMNFTKGIQEKEQEQFKGSRNEMEMKQQQQERQMQEQEQQLMQLQSQQHINNIQQEQIQDVKQQENYFGYYHDTFGDEQYDSPSFTEQNEHIQHIQHNYVDQNMQHSQNNPHIQHNNVDQNNQYNQNNQHNQHNQHNQQPIQQQKKERNSSGKTKKQKEQTMLESTNEDTILQEIYQLCKEINPRLTKPPKFSIQISNNI